MEQLSLFGIPPIISTSIESQVLDDSNDTFSLHFSSAPLQSPLRRALEKTTYSQRGGDFLAHLPQMDEGYDDFKSLMLALRGKWSRGHHRFQFNPEPFIQQILKEGYLPKINPYALFETQDEEIENLFEMVNLPEGPEWDSIKICEPSAGNGRIATKIRERLPKSILHIAEIDPLNRATLKAANFNIIGHNWLNTKPTQQYDFIITNPPFQGLNFLDHLLKDYACLKPYGEIAAIVSDAFLTSNTKKAILFRNLVAETGYWERFEAKYHTPTGLSRPIKCVLLSLRKDSDRLRQSLWEVSSRGYRSAFSDRICLALECDSAWYEFLCNLASKPDTSWYSKIEAEVKQVITQWIDSEGWCFYFDPTVLQHVIADTIDRLNNVIIPYHSVY